jgi:outer membrane protein TolC
VLLDLRAFPVYSQTKSDRDAARLEASEVTRSVAFEAAAAFLQTLGLGQVRQSAERRMALTAQSLADSQARFDAQIVGSNDVTRAELEVATAERELIRSKNAEHEALLNLGFLIGVPVESIATPDNSVLQSLSEEQKSVDELVTAAIQRRLDLAASGKRIEALHLFAKEPLYRYAPAFNLTGEYKYNNEAGFAGKTTTWAVSVSGVWTLFDGFARQADRQERLSLARAAELEREQRVRKVSVEIKTALSALETARAAIELATVAEAAARKNTSETTELYRNGLSTAFAVADSTQRLFEAEVALTREKLTLALAALDLRSALGFDPFGRETK